MSFVFIYIYISEWLHLVRKFSTCCIFYPCKCLVRLYYPHFFLSKKFKAPADEVTCAWSWNQGSAHLRMSQNLLCPKFTFFPLPIAFSEFPCPWGPYVVARETEYKETNHDNIRKPESTFHVKYVPWVYNRWGTLYLCRGDMSGNQGEGQWRLTRGEGGYLSQAWDTWLIKLSCEPRQKQIKVRRWVNQERLD